MWVGGWVDGAVGWSQSSFMLCIKFFVDTVVYGSWR